jgi:hypothetical protein
MIFKGVDNQIVELKITNYQYPDNNDGDWDGNWLNIYLSVTSKVGRWQIVHPSLTTWEVQSLIDWFDRLSNDSRPEYPDLGFTEPNLSFELLNDYNTQQKIFRIKFALESRPQSASNDQEFFVDVIADNYQLKKLSTDLKSELDNYPERKATHN